MYPNIYKEMAAHDRMTIKQLAAKLGISPNSLSNKLNGRSDFKLGEMSKMQNLFSGYTLDELFRQR